MTPSTAFGSVLEAARHVFDSLFPMWHLWVALTLFVMVSTVVMGKKAARAPQGRATSKRQNG